MTSKFAPLTKLKKEKLEEARRKLLEADLYIQELHNTLSLLEAELQDQRPPTSGSIALFKQYSLLTQASHDQIIRKKDEIYYAKQQKNKLQNTAQDALVEYEKFNYLQLREEEEHLMRLKREEALQLDEVAIMGYNLQKERF